MRSFLSGLDELVSGTAILVAVMLAGDAFRYGTPPVSLRLRLVADGCCLRVEVEDHGWARPYGYRAGFLDRIASRQGLARTDDGMTMIWAEIPTQLNANESHRMA